MNIKLSLGRGKNSPSKILVCILRMRGIRILLTKKWNKFHQVPRSSEAKKRGVNSVTPSRIPSDRPPSLLHKYE